MRKRDRINKCNQLLNLILRFKFSETNIESEKLPSCKTLENTLAHSKKKNLSKVVKKLTQKKTFQSVEARKKAAQIATNLNQKALTSLLIMTLLMLRICFLIRWKITHKMQKKIKKCFYNN